MGSHPVGATRAQTTAEVEAEPLTELPDDAWVSFALVVPYAMPWRSHALTPALGKDMADEDMTRCGLSGDARTVLDSNKITRLSWSPTAFGLDPHSSTYRHWFEPHSYFASPRIGGIATASRRYQFWVPDALRPEPLEALREVGLEVLAVERHEFTTEPADEVSEDDSVEE